MSFEINTTQEVNIDIQVKRSSGLDHAHPGIKTNSQHCTDEDTGSAIASHSYLKHLVDRNLV